LKCISKILNHFDDVYIVESWDNNFKLKIKKNSNGNTIGFLFGLMEDQKQECFLAEYSISQTSLEQIFNKFASENETVLNLNEPNEYKMTNEYLHSLLKT
jgi:hypothetical protein